MRIAQLRAYMEKWKARLGIWHWQTIIETVPADTLHDGTAEAVAEVESWYYLLTNIIRMADGEDDDTTRSAVVHELLHTLLLDMRMAAQMIIDTMGDEARAMATEQFRRAEEHAVVRLTRAFREMEAVADGQTNG